MRPVDGGGRDPPLRAPDPMVHCRTGRDWRIEDFFGCRPTASVVTPRDDSGLVIDLDMLAQQAAEWLVGGSFLRARCHFPWRTSSNDPTTDEDAREVARSDLPCPATAGHAAQITLSTCEVRQRRPSNRTAARRARGTWLADKPGRTGRPKHSEPEHGPPLGPPRFQQQARAADSRKGE